MQPRPNQRLSLRKHQTVNLGRNKTKKYNQIKKKKKKGKDLQSRRRITKKKEKKKKRRLEKKRGKKKKGKTKNDSQIGRRGILIDTGRTLSPTVAYSAAASYKGQLGPIGALRVQPRPNQRLSLRKHQTVKLDAEQHKTIQH